MEVERIIRDYIKGVAHMSIATTQNNKPWISEVHFSYDENLNLYFISRPNRRHSLEAVENNQIAGNIVKQYGAGESVRGVYFEGTVRVLENVSELDISFTTYNERFTCGNSVLREQDEENGHRCYKVVVNTFYLYDELEMNPAGKYELSWNASN